MRTRTALALCLCLAGALAQAQKPPSGPVNVVFEKPGGHQVWVSQWYVRPDADAITKTDDPSAKVDTNVSGKSISIHVLDESTGNLAAIHVADLKGSEWKLTARDYQFIAKVVVRVESKGKPVAAASVELEDGKGVKFPNRILDPASKGEAEFFQLYPGTLKVKVAYRTKAGRQEPYAVSFPVAHERDKPVPVLVVALPEETTTVSDQTGTTGSAEKAPESAAPAAANPDRGLNLAVMLITLAVLGTAGYFAVKWFRNDPQRLKATLKKLGAEIPEPMAAPDANQVSVQPAAPQPPPQILLDDAAPTPLGNAPPIPAASTGGTPSLVGSAGQTLKLDEGLFILGREEGLPFSFPEEQTLSRKHAEVLCEAGRVIVTDLGSTNGTFVNGVKISSETELKPGDQVQFGAMKFRFER
ncbi:MAG: FHA domain-containing protein [Armatimonadetes bacterium]|nr:FHA domain-containing protein [Armatimonadota bacterium]